ncbi:MAG: CRISPR-associated endoribonuclease Cas6, partial [Bacteroidota bacterium]
VNYQYLIGAWIHRCLSKVGPKLDQWLRHKGYNPKYRQYELFCYSSLQPRGYNLNPKNLSFTLASHPTKVEISFHMDRDLESSMVKVFQKQKFYLKGGPYRVDFQVAKVEVLPPPEWREQMSFRLMTPLCLSKTVEGKSYPQYLHPEDHDYEQILTSSLWKKYQLITYRGLQSEEINLSPNFPRKFELLSSYKYKRYRVKGIDTIGYLFDFRMELPLSLMQLGYQSGFGEKCSDLGMGMVQILPPPSAEHSEESPSPEN